MNVFRAVGDPTRRFVLDQLIDGPRPARALQAATEMTQPALSQHLKVLRDAGLVAVTPVGRERVYSLTPEPLRAVSDWIGRYEQFWDRRFAALGVYLDEAHDDPS